MDGPLERWHSLATSQISDALDRLGILGGCSGLVPIVQGAKLVGRAYTVHYIPCGATKGTVGDYIDDAESESVIVLDNGGRCYCTVWGDILTTVAKANGVAGTVIDGVCRDVDTIRSMKYPVYAKGHFMVTGKDRVEVDAVQVSVTIGQVKVSPNDIVVGDDSGVVVVPRDHADEVYRIASEIDAAEEEIIRLLSEGYSIKAARERYGYHTLQRKGEGG